VAAGVDALIARLRDEGVNSGRSQADQIVAKGLPDKRSCRFRFWLVDYINKPFA
jgi:hypothetical protein